MQNNLAKLTWPLETWPSDVNEISITDPCNRRSQPSIADDVTHARECVLAVVATFSFLTVDSCRSGAPLVCSHANNEDQKSSIEMG